MRISDWSSDVCSSDLHARGLVLEDVAVDHPVARVVGDERDLDALVRRHQHRVLPLAMAGRRPVAAQHPEGMAVQMDRVMPGGVVVQSQIGRAHVELQSLMRISYAGFCLKKKTINH